MSVNAAGGNKKKTLIGVVASVVILVAVATVISMAIPRPRKTVTPAMMPNGAEIVSLAAD